jgi:glutathione S-transferase
MKLYQSQFTRSGRARWTLEELGVPYDITRLSFREGQNKTPEYLEIHPHGSVPALVDGDLKLYESSAIVMHLADKFPEKKLAPAPGTDERADYYRWLVYVPATVDPVLEQLTVQLKFTPEDKRNQSVIDAAKRKLVGIGKVLEGAVDGREYVVGNAFTAADIVVSSAIGWIAFLGMLGDYPKLEAYYKAMQQRPAFQRAHAD